MLTIVDTLLKYMPKYQEPDESNSTSTSTSSSGSSVPSYITISVNPILVSGAGNSDSNGTYNFTSYSDLGMSGETHRYSVLWNKVGDDTGVNYIMYFSDSETWELWGEYGDYYYYYNTPGVNATGTWYITANGGVSLVVPEPSVIQS